MICDLEKARQKSNRMVQFHTQNPERKQPSSFDAAMECSLCTTLWINVEQAVNGYPPFAAEKVKKSIEAPVIQVHKRK